MPKGLCLRCRKAVDIENGVEIKTPRGDTIISGNCACSNKVISLVKPEPESTN